MDIKPTAPTLSPAQLTRTASVLAAAWRAGAALEALVTHGSAAGGTVKLLVQGREVEVRSEVPLRAGQRLLLTAAERPAHWQLRLPETPGPSPLEQALRQVLPRQQPLAPALAALIRLASESGLAPLREWAARLHGHIPEPRQLTTPKGLQQAVNGSGMFLEARLAARQAPPAGSASQTPPTSGPPGPTPSNPSGTNVALPAVAPRDPLPPAAPVRPIAGGDNPAGSSAAPPTVAGATPSADGNTARLPGTVSPSLLSSSPATTDATHANALPAASTLTLPSGGIVGGDLKALLLRLFSLLRAPPSRSQDGAPHERTTAVETLRALARQADGALARIELHQFRATPEDPDGGGPAWVMELPFRQGAALETLTLRIRRDPEQKDDPDAPAPWTVTLELGDAGAGALRAVIGLHGRAVSTRFFAERAEMAERINASLRVLDTRLRAAGLDVDTLEAHTGRATGDEEPMPSGLLQERV